MPKGILKYDLSQADEMREYQMAVAGKEMALFIWELKHNILRSAYKQDMTGEELADKIWDHLKESNIHVDLWIE